MDSFKTEPDNLSIKVSTTDNILTTSTSTAPTTTISPSHSENVLRRDHESVDDFEHLDPESSPVKETVTEPAISQKDTEPVVPSVLTGLGEQVKTILDDSVPEAAGTQPNLLDLQFEENAAVSKIMDESDKHSADMMQSEKTSEPIKPLPATLSADIPVDFLNRAATAPSLPTHLVDPSDEFEAVRESSAFMSDKIQFESGIDLSDLMVSNKTEEEDEEEEAEDEIKEHVPKAKEELEALYRTEPKHSNLKVDDHEEAQVSDREDDAAFVMAEKEEELDRAATPEPEVEEQEVPPPVPEHKTSVVPAKEDPRPKEPEPAAKPKADTPPPQSTEDEIAACDLTGLCAWFHPDSLHPTVGQLVYWRDPKKSGLVFGGVLVVLLSLSVFSLISVVAYLSLAILTLTIIFRVYKSILQAVQKTEDGHPFKDLLEAEIALTQDKVQEVTETAVAHVNGAVAELRRLFLVEDLVDSIKFGVLLWCLTYVGAWFNGMTLIILAFVGIFTLPKVYENNKAQIDQYLDIVRSRMSDISSKVKAAIPIGKKENKDKEQ